jgi:hypothetical protein
MLRVFTLLVALMARPVEGLRFLCLHGGGGTAAHFRQELASLTNALSAHTFVVQSASDPRQGSAMSSASLLPRC